MKTLPERFFGLIDSIPGMLCWLFGHKWDEVVLPRFNMHRFKCRRCGEVR